MGEFEVYKCPLCGWERPIKYGIKQRNAGARREVRFDKIDVEKAHIWKLLDMSGAGKGSKDATIEEVDYKELRWIPQDIKDQIKDQCIKILKELEK